MQTKEIKMRCIEKATEVVLARIPSTMMNSGLTPIDTKRMAKWIIAIATDLEEHILK